MTDVTWIGNVEEDPENPGEMVLTFPEGLLEKMGWEVGTELVWNIDENGEVSLTRADGLVK